MLLFLFVCTLVPLISILLYLYREYWLEDVKGAWMIRGKLARMAMMKGDQRLAAYYDYLGDDIVDEFFYGKKTERHQGLEKAEKGLWLNLGYWRGARRYQKAAKEMAILLSRVASLSSASSVLDAGCGFAEQDILWSSLFPNISSFTCLDLTPLHVKVAKERTRSMQDQDRVKIILGSATDFVPSICSEGSVDRVVALESAFHFDTREKFLKQAFRALSPGGRIALADMIPIQGTNFNSFLQKFGRWYTHIPQANMITQEEYIEQLSSIGFVNINILPVSEWVFPYFCYFGTQDDSLSEMKGGGSSTGEEEGEETPSVYLSNQFREESVDSWFRFSGISEYVIVSADKPT